MPTFVPPFDNSGSWNHSVELISIPKGLRYGGYQLRALNSTNVSNQSIRVPAKSFLKKHSSAGEHFLELQFMPFLSKEIAKILPGGLPTFYFSFPNDNGFAALEENKVMAENEVLRSSDNVKFGIISQDRMTRDPIAWSTLILNALTTIGENTASWQVFHTSLITAFQGNSRPVILLNSAGQVRQNATVDLVYTTAGGNNVHSAIMIPADEGDLQKTVARMNAANPATMSIANIWGGGATSFILRPSVPAAERAAFQFARLEDQLEGAGQIEVTPSLCHIQFTHVHDWIALQFVAGTPLQRFSRGNKITPFINGPEFFDEIFRELHTANSIGNGFHHVGWAVKHDDKLTKLKDSDPADLSLKLKDALQRISDGNGKICVLPARFYQINPDIPISEITKHSAIILLLLQYSALGSFLGFYGHEVELFDIDFKRTDPVGVVIVTILLAASFFIPLIEAELLGDDSILFDEDGNFMFEDNIKAKEFIDDLPNGTSALSTYPAKSDDNHRIQGNWLLDIGMNISKNFGVYHQKFSILKNPSGIMAYCGGIDMNPDRLDDENRLADNPFHDTHLKIQGPAVRDIAQSFQERWQADVGSLTDLSFSIPTAASLGTPGDHIVQFGRTYFKSSEPTPLPPSPRALSFAPQGDRTLLNTILQAINQAKEYIYIEDQYLTPPEEYRTALIQKVSTQSIKKLIIVVPHETDQPFGDIEKMGFIQALKLADVSGDILHVGHPRIKYNATKNEMRSSSGKLLLMADLDKDAAVFPNEEFVSLGSGPRLPSPPFYLSINGELMYAYKIQGSIPSEAESENTIRQSIRSFAVKRGNDLPDMGTHRIAHKAGAAVTVINYNNVYVHSKTMIIDDIFLSLGSANINRRGFYHDGEAQTFSLPQKLGTAINNPIRDLRMKLWADILNLPRDLATSLLRDPIASAKLFLRTPQQGNRFVDLKGRGPIQLLGSTSTSGAQDIIMQSLLLGTIIPFFTYDKFYKTIVDPTTGLEPASP